jgi:hypothetical protein
MLEINFPAVLLSALVPLLVGFIYYHPKVLGTIWMKTAGITPDSNKKENMMKLLIIMILVSIPLAFFMQFLVIHQFHFYSMLANDKSLEIAGSPLNTFFTETMAKYGSEFRTFKHGAFHGSFSGIVLAMPIITISSLFENKNWKYVLIHTGYWIITMGLMGGIISGFPA